MNTLCHRASPLLGGRVIRRKEGLEIINTPDEFIVVNDHPGGRSGCDSTKMGCRLIAMAMC